MPPEQNRVPAAPSDADAELKAMAACLESLGALDEAARQRVVQYLVDRFAPGATTVRSAPSSAGHGSPRADASLNPKRFFADKAPTTDVERVTVLGYYLAQIGLHRFDTADLQQANRDAAGSNFNIIEGAKSAVKRGYLAPAGEGKRQITALGESVVEALPDRTAVAEVLNAAGKRSSGTRRRTVPRRK